MILMFLTWAGVLDDVLDFLHMPQGSYVRSLVKVPQRSMKFLEFLLELMMILMFGTVAGVLNEILDGLHMP